VALTKGQKLPAVLKSGLKLDLTADEACTATITVTVDKATARKLKLTAKARKVLKKAKTVKFGVAVSAKDAAGNTGAKAATLTLKK
jgi:hypothetical protein